MLWVTDGRAKTLMDRQVFQVSSLSVSFWPVFSLSTYRTIYLCIKLASFLPISLIYQASCLSIKLAVYLSIYLSILSYPFLSYPILSYPILSYPTLSYPILSHPILPYPILSNISVLGHISLQNRSKTPNDLSIWLGNVLLTTTACTLPTSIPPEVVCAWSVLCILICEMCFAPQSECPFSFLISPQGSATRRFSEPRERERVRVGRKKVQAREMLGKSRSCIFFSSLLYCSLFFSSLLSDSAYLCVSSLHICRKFDF